ncbi:DUF2306 domain-containing protein [Yoonia litorea]|uniref:Predicted membrane protein n=1 Tax=Yoonia litorea TaxID=1123755 RepID=A0A1I6N1C4_9RHOB|nr:DUF2306 domain-containing protein [Yoonia litorea]SFS21765.1 Predicted membrane protein [Yoonia litorea]
MTRIITMSLLALLMLPFALYSVDFGQGGLRDRLAEPHYLQTDSASANLALFSHMILGGIVTCLVPFQLIGRLRDRYPQAHRWSGRLIALSALVTAFGGLVFITLKGTIGGAVMDAGFALYGALLLLTAGMAWRMARQGDFERHRAWALRFFWLAIGSWLYRVQYGLWYLATDGLWSEPDFSGSFDLAMNFAFYLPYLIGVEIYLRMKKGNTDSVLRGTA